MKVIPLQEGQFTIDQSKQFIPVANRREQSGPLPGGSLLVDIQPFVVVTEKDILLLDTGLGLEEQGALQLHHHLLDQGIQPAQVTKVLLTHLHKDHAGGVCHRSPTGIQELAFPAAQYYVQKQEFITAMSQRSASYEQESLACLSAHPSVVFLEGDGFIDNSIRYQLTGAHSPFHQVFWISEQGHTLFFGGDEAPQLQQMKSRYIAKYDFNGRKSMELRQQWWAQGQREGWAFLFYHDTRYPVYPE
ncbi:MAG: MBL fold metallo-hydrolase [Chitinophagaceae bacterium]